jgi:hypothetical protein
MRQKPENDGVFQSPPVLRWHNGWLGNGTKLPLAAAMKI